MNSENIRLSKIIPISYANGPGPHYTIWFQGCKFNCLGCFNPEMHDPTKGFLKNIDELINEIQTYWLKKEIRGVTLTGGEPLYQIDATITLINRIKSLGNVGLIILTGFTKKELTGLPEYSILCQKADVLIAGRFMEDQKFQVGLKGSKNKECLIFSDFYSSKELDEIPPVEVIASQNGEVIITGIKPEIVSENDEVPIETLISEK